VHHHQHSSDEEGKWSIGGWESHSANDSNIWAARSLTSTHPCTHVASPPSSHRLPQRSPNGCLSFEHKVSQLQPLLDSWCAAGHVHDGGDNNARALAACQHTTRTLAEGCSGCDHNHCAGRCHTSVTDSWRWQLHHRASVRRAASADVTGSPSRGVCGGALRHCKVQAFQRVGTCTAGTAVPSLPSQLW
jgi:hypothetical protein